MIRLVLRGMVMLAAITLLIESAIGQPPIPDKIVVRDKNGTTKNYDGTLRFGPVGFQIVPLDKKAIVTVAPNDIVKIVPGEMEGLDRGIVMAQITLEDKKTKKDYETARLGYEDMLKKGPSVPVPSKRYLEFKLALMISKIADESADDEKWSDLAGEAVKAWANYLGEYKTSWEVWPATKAYTRLLAEMNKYDEIARTWARTGKTADLPSDLKLEANLQEIDAQIRSKGFSVAKPAIEALAKAAPPGPVKEKLAIYELAANAAESSNYTAGVTDIEKKIGESKDPGVRGIGYGMIGELYLMAGKPRDAMWAFLWVETVYNPDRDESFKAMCRLVETFKLQGDDERAKAYRDKIRRARGNF
jgi:hypothetical protein